MSFDRKNTPKLAAASEVGHTFEPTYPDGTPLGAEITVRGIESPVVQAIIKRNLAGQQAREAMAKKRGRDVDPLTLDEMVAMNIEMAITVTIGWKGFEDSGVPMEATEENLRAIYTDYSWIRDQVLAEARDLGNFAKPSLKTSSRTSAPSSSLI